MSKVVALKLSEAEYRELMECYYLGFFIKDSMDDNPAQVMLEQAQYAEKFFEAGIQQGIHLLAEGIEETTLQRLDEYDEYIASGEAAQDNAKLEKQVEEFVKQYNQQQSKPKKKK